METTDSTKSKIGRTCKNIFTIEFIIACVVLLFSGLLIYDGMKYERYFEANKLMNMDNQQKLVENQDTLTNISKVMSQFDVNEGYFFTQMIKNQKLQTQILNKTFDLMIFHVNQTFK